MCSILKGEATLLHRFVCVSFCRNPIKYEHTHTTNNAREGEGTMLYTMENALNFNRGQKNYRASSLQDSPIEHVGAHVMCVVENANHGDGKQRQHAASHIDAETATRN